MPIVEEGINYPTVLGRRNIPSTIIRVEPIARLPMALVGGETPVHLAQRLRAQLTKYPIIPILDRPHPVLDAIKEMVPIVPRVKLLGAFGIVDPSQAKGSISPKRARAVLSVQM